MVKFSVSYVTTLPKLANAPNVTITGNEQKAYTVYFLTSVGDLICQTICLTNQTVSANSRQWYTEWIIIIKDDNDTIVFKDCFNLNNKTVFIKFDSYALGDTIAWMAYVEEFRLKHNCTIICSTFHNDLFIEVYPNILFIKPNSTIHNTYAQYYIGAVNDELKYSPLNVNEIPLQKIATTILGLPYVELRPKIISKHSQPKYTNKYVTLSEFGSHDCKHWQFLNGWQMIVDYLNQQGYDVIVISKEKTNLQNIIDLSGNYSLQERIDVIKFAEFHLGVSSGLSWLAWALNTHVVLISDVTPIWHEFTNNVTRICANELTSVNYNIDTITTPNHVITKLAEYIQR